VPRPSGGRVFTARRRVRLSDVDGGGRLRLDAVARYLQDVASDDVAETGWGAPAHAWVVRRTRIDLVVPFRSEEEVTLATWCSGVGGAAAGRRTSLEGDRGGRIEAESVWIHLAPDGRPARLDPGFLGVYAATAGDRRVSSRLALPDPPANVVRSPWPLRVTDIDQLGHVNNAAYWEAVEDRLAASELEAAGPLHAVLEYRSPVDLGDGVELAVSLDARRLAVAFVVAGSVRAVAALQA
jgi:acyl-ACP thioesterase